jgi:hypothetical protein
MELTEKCSRLRGPPRDAGFFRRPALIFRIDLASGSDGPACGLNPDPACEKLGVRQPHQEQGTSDAVHETGPVFADPLRNWHTPHSPSTHPVPTAPAAALHEEGERNHSEMQWTTPHMVTTSSRCMCPRIITDITTSAAFRFFTASRILHFHFYACYHVSTEQPPIRRCLALSKHNIHTP